MESESHEDQTMDLGHWEAIIKFEAKSGKGRAMVITLAPDELLLVFTDCRFNIQGKGKNADKAWQYLKVEEGQYQNGTFHPDRILNGDETDWGGPKATTPRLLHITLTTR